MGSCGLTVLLALFIAFHFCVANIFVPVHLSCKCAKTTSKYIRPKQYEKVEIFPSGVACMKMEIIITLKNGQKMCIEPNAKWVQKLVKIMGKTKEANSSS